MYGQVIGYAYEADVHCISCSFERFPELQDDTSDYRNHVYVEDNESNPVTAYLSGQDTDDLTDTLVCGDCFTILYEVEMEPQPRERLYIDHLTTVPRESLMHDGAFMATADGGYPYLYRTDGGSTLCAPCATTNDTDHDDDLLLGADIFYEGEPEICENCNASIASAYGDPSDDSDQE